MNKDNNALLADILASVGRIFEYIKSMNYDQFEEDYRTQDAVIRHFEIIGEASNKLSKDFSDENPGFPVKDAVEMRNVLIHGYDQVNLKVVWKTIKNDLPNLHQWLTKITKA